MWCLHLVIISLNREVLLCHKKTGVLVMTETCVLAPPHNTCVVVTHKNMYMMCRCTQSCLGPIPQFHFSILPSYVMLGVHMKHELTVQLIMQLRLTFLEFSTFHKACDYIQGHHPIIIVLFSSWIDKSNVWTLVCEYEHNIIETTGLKCLWHLTLSHVESRNGYGVLGYRGIGGDKKK